MDNSFGSIKGRVHLEIEDNIEQFLITLLYCIVSILVKLFSLWMLDASSK